MFLEATTLLPTEQGRFHVSIFRNADGVEITAIIHGNVEGRQALPVRIHSACFTSEVLGSLKCDCKQQIHYAMDYIGHHDGIVIYLPQEGRGIGLGNKIKAYALQEQGYDTIEANEQLGLPVDGRTYEDARDILSLLKVESIRLLTNNPDKISAMVELGVSVEGRLPVPAHATADSVAYLDTKRELMGHMLAIHPAAPSVNDKPSFDAINRPHVHVNFALDSQAHMAGDKGEAISLSCDEDWKRVHQLREKYCAVAIGANTWSMDDPRLTVRENILGREPKRQPARVIFAGHHQCQIKQDPQKRCTYVIGEPEGHYQEQPIVISCQDHDLAEPLAELRQKGIKAMLVEGGLTLIRSFLQQQMIDVVTIFVRTDCINTAIQSATQALPDLAADSIEARFFGEGVLLTSSLQASEGTPEHYGVAI